MQSYLQPGEVLTLAAPYDRTSGQGALVGGIFGVAVDTVLSGADGQFLTKGVFTLAKTSAQEWAVGDRLYWDNTNKRCDTDGTVGMFIGHATATAANPSSTGEVKLASGSQMLEGPQTTIADLAAISGGESPTEAEHNLVVAKVNALLAALEVAGVLKSA